MGHIGEVRSFESWEDMDEFMARQRQLAVQAITPAMRGLLDGRRHYWKRPVPEQGFTVYGVLPDLDRLRAQQLADAGTDDEAQLEAVYEDEVLRANLADGYMFGRAYSVLEPRGEWGTTHVTQVVEISEDEFLAAQERRWVDAV